MCGQKPECRSSGSTREPSSLEKVDDATVKETPVLFDKRFAAGDADLQQPGKSRPQGDILNRNSFQDNLVNDDGCGDCRVPAGATWVPVADPTVKETPILSDSCFLASDAGVQQPGKSRPQGEIVNRNFSQDNLLIKLGDGCGSVHESRERSRSLRQINAGPKAENRL